MNIQNACEFLNAYSTITRMSNAYPDPLVKTLMESIDILVAYARQNENRKSCEAINKIGLTKTKI